MAKQITFISTTELKDNSIIQSNVSEKILNQAILEFQELELEPLLGMTLYRRLSNEVVKTTIDKEYFMSDDDSELMRYISKYLVYGALTYSFNELHYQVSNKGIHKLTDGNSQTGSDRDISTLKSTYDNKLALYKSRLIDYMRTDESEETEVSPSSSNDTTFNFTGIAMNDDSYDWETEYKNSAYKTGYFRRRLF